MRYATKYKIALLYLLLSPVTAAMAKGNTFDLLFLEKAHPGQGTGLSQERFSALFHISVGTLRNWEQGRRRPDGPAAALLIAINNDPEHVVNALNSAA